MNKERLKIMLDLYRNYEGEEDLDSMVAELREKFLDHEVVNKKHNHDISNELACGSEHVLYYLAEYLDILEQQNKRYREALMAIANNDTYVATEQDIAIYALEGEE